MYSRHSVDLYDLIYEARGRDYGQEASEVRALLGRYHRGSGTRLLDVACGSGAHLEQLSSEFQVMGIDVDPNMLRVARERLPAAELRVADMADFDLGRRFDVILCLFSSIAYVRTLDKLKQSLASFARHLQPDGLIIIEPWYTPTTFTPDTVSVVEIEKPGLRIVRVNVSRSREGHSILDLHYFVAAPDGIRQFVENHVCGLFSQEDFASAASEAGLTLLHRPRALRPHGEERGLYLGTLKQGRDAAG